MKLSLKFVCLATKEDAKTNANVRTHVCMYVHVLVVIKQLTKTIQQMPPLHQYANKMMKKSIQNLLRITGNWPVIEDFFFKSCSLAEVSINQRISWFCIASRWNLYVLCETIADCVWWLFYFFIKKGIELYLGISVLSNFEWNKSAHVFAIFTLEIFTTLYNLRGALH